MAFFPKGHGATDASPSFVDRDGTIYVVVDASGHAADITALPPEMRMPSNRHLYTLYKVEGTLGTYTNPNNGASSPSIRLLSARPIIIIGGSAIDQQLLGTWEGLVSRRTGDGTWSLDTDRVPFRVTFTSTAPLSDLPTWGPGTPLLPDGERFEIDGMIENATNAVTSATGECFSALSSYGDADPIFGATSSELKLYRLTSMHVEGDAQLVIGYPDGTKLGVGMGDIAPVHPASLLQEAPAESWGAGSHNSWTFSLDMHRASGGGLRCGGST
jgi:hypothetical protein